MVYRTSIRADGKAAELSSAFLGQTYSVYQTVSGFVVIGGVTEGKLIARYLNGRSQEI